jgi:S1-C subfamily serine protease/predicted esterase
MARRFWFPLTIALAWLATAVPPAAAADEELNDLVEKAIKAATKKVAPSVVQINTLGGTDIVVSGPRGNQIRKAMGPTTGVIIGADGYIISSAFNFINQPKTILVSVPGHPKPFQAKVVANDGSRMLTLLKIDAKGLPVPVPAPKKEIKVGQWSVALGRTLDLNVSNIPSISIGIVSALDRIWGRAVQTDAKISPVNYGGPLIDIRGRVQGILVPASTSGTDATAGTEWYDSGIGFAIPMDDINAVLPRLKKGENLRRGLLGVNMRTPDYYGAAPVVGMVTPGSAAQKAGIQVGDQITEIDGKPVARLAQILHLIGPKYEGDRISVKVKRGGKEIEFKNFPLVGTLAAFAHPFLGILPLRDDPELGVQVRYVYPKSPADQAGLKEGDRIMKVGLAKGPLVPLDGRQKSGRDQLLDIINPLQVGTEIKLEVVRKGGGKPVVLTAKLDSLPETKVNLLPETLPEIASAKKSLDTRAYLDQKTGKVVKSVPPKGNPKMPDTGLLEKTDPSGQHKYYVYVHEDYDPNIAQALVLWLHPAGKFDKENDIEAFQEAWDDFCKDNQIILVMPITKAKRGWLPSESDWIVNVTKAVRDTYNVDRQRVIVHGMAVGGQMAYHLGFYARDLFRGVATSGAVFTNPPKDNLANQRLSFFVVAGEKDPLAKPIAQNLKKVAERKFPIIHREIKNMGAQYMLDTTLKELVRWIDSLDRI